MYTSVLFSSLKGRVPVFNQNWYEVKQYGVMSVCNAICGRTAAEEPHATGR